MDNYICIGKIINTFGIKGELKITSDFEYKNKVFKKNFNIYIGNLKSKEIINTYRVHKNYDLILFNNYKNINEVLKYKGEKIYISREELQLNVNEYLLQDLIGLEVYDNDKLLGSVIDYENMNNNVLLKVKGKKVFYIPKVDTYIKKINIKRGRIDTINGSDLII